jgi:5'-nucleotidase
MARPLILLANDDGIHAEGLAALERALAPLGRVYTVAPETEQSAMSHAMTLHRPLRMRRLAERRFAVDGTPVDCVYVALHLRDVLPERPAVVVSGINHGLNLGGDVFYSGTVAAAREGALRGIPAVAVSLAAQGDRDAAGEIAAGVVRTLLARALAGRPPLLNINVPAGRVRGVWATRLGERLYEDSVEARTDPRGRQYLWLGGAGVSHPPSEGTDTAAHEAGYASVTPLGIELFRADQFDLAVDVAAQARAGAKPGANARTPRKTTARAGAARAASRRSERRG